MPFLSARTETVVALPYSLFIHHRSGDGRAIAPSMRSSDTSVRECCFLNDVNTTAAICSVYNKLAVSYA